MLFLRLWNFTRGYVIIFIETCYVEKFINICMRRQVFLWDLKKTRSKEAEVKLSIKGFKLLRPIAKKSHSKIRIQKKVGLPFFINKYKGRKAFIFGAFFFVFIIYFLMSFVWEIEVIGNRQVQTNYIHQQLAQIDVKPGILKYNIDIDKIANTLILNTKELSWVNVSLKGTKIKVSVAERKTEPNLVPKDIPCNIIAKRDGLIRSVTAKTGENKVVTGDTVIEGQLLISGNIENKDPSMPPKLVHAIGNVIARTWYEGLSNVETSITYNRRTGRKQDLYSLKLMAKKTNVLHRKIKFEMYEKDEINKKFTILKDLVIPIEIDIDRLYEIEKQQKIMAFHEAVSLAKETAYKKALDIIPKDAKIVKADVSINEENEKIVARALIECLEEISVEVKM